MLARLLIAAALIPLALGGCASTNYFETEQMAQIGAPEHDPAAIVPRVETAPPLVQADGTAIAGWSARDEVDDIVLRATSADATRGSVAPYQLDSGDKLRVFVYAQPSLSRIYTIDGEGFISVPLIGNVRARSRTTRGLEGEIRGRLGVEFVRDPNVTVDIQQYRPFYILGEVKNAGQFPFVAGMTVDAAAAIAGGYSERANERKIQITRRTDGGMEKMDVPGDAIVRPGDTLFVKERWF